MVNDAPHSRFDAAPPAPKLPKRSGKMIADHLDRTVRPYPVFLGELITLPLLNSICAALLGYALEAMWFLWDLSAKGEASTTEYERTKFVMIGAFVIAGLLQLLHLFLVFRIWWESRDR